MQVRTASVFDTPEELKLLELSKRRKHEPMPLDPLVRRHQMVEYITTKERPSRVHLADEELYDNQFTQFGAACRNLPSSCPQRMTTFSRESP